MWGLEVFRDVGCGRDELHWETREQREMWICTQKDTLTWTVMRVCFVLPVVQWWFSTDTHSWETRTCHIPRVLYTWLYECVCACVCACMCLIYVLMSLYVCSCLVFHDDKTKRAKDLCAFKVQWDQHCLFRKTKRLPRSLRSDRKNTHIWCHFFLFKKNTKERLTHSGFVCSFL